MGKTTSKKSPTHASKTSPSKHHFKRTKMAGSGCVLNKSNEVVWTIRLKAGVWVAFVVKGSNRTKGAYIQHLVNLARSNDASVKHLGISSIILRRTPDGSNYHIMDGTYPMRQFVRILDDDEEDSADTVKAWGMEIAQKLTDLNKSSTYPTVCIYGGDLTPSTGPPSVDTHILNNDVVQIARYLYGSSIDDGTFFDEILDDDEQEDKTLAKKFFAHTNDPRTLFTI